jgi:hypothetical protein
MSKKKVTILLILSTLILLIFLLVSNVVTHALSSFRSLTIMPSPTLIPQPTATSGTVYRPSPNLPPQLNFTTSGWHPVLREQGTTPLKEGDSLLLGTIPGGKETVIYHACPDGTGGSYLITIGSTITGYVSCDPPPWGETAGEGSFDIRASRLSTASSYPVRVVSTGTETSYTLLIGQPD